MQIDPEHCQEIMAGLNNQGEVGRAVKLEVTETELVTQDF